MRQVIIKCDVCGRDIREDETSIDAQVLLTATNWDEQATTVEGYDICPDCYKSMVAAVNNEGSAVMSMLAGIGSALAKPQQEEQEVAPVSSKAGRKIGNSFRQGIDIQINDSWHRFKTVKEFYEKYFTKDHKDGGLFTFVSDEERQSPQTYLQGQKRLIQLAFDRQGKGRVCQCIKRRTPEGTEYTC